LGVNKDIWWVKTCSIYPRSSVLLLQEESQLSRNLEKNNYSYVAAVDFVLLAMDNSTTDVI